MSTAALFPETLPFDQAARSAIARAVGGTLGADEIAVDLFAGGGGATCGIEAAGLVVHECVNHSAVAIATHAANHPQTNHRCGDVWGNAPQAVAGTRAVGLLWASPDCRHFSRARGAAPVSGRVRSLAWVVIKWAKELARAMGFPPDFDWSDGAGGQLSNREIVKMIGNAVHVDVAEALVRSVLPRGSAPERGERVVGA